MKNQFVSGLQDGDVVNDYFVATRKDLRDTQRGSKFLGLVFKDKTGEIGGVMWNNAQTVAAMFELGDVVNVRATVTTYQEKLQLRVDQVLPLKEGEYALEDLVFEPEGREDAFDSFKALLGTVEGEPLATLVASVFDDEALMTKFRDCAAGKRWHHAFRGGLVQHCFEMATIAETMCTLFPQIDRELLLTGVLLHDIGKVEELSQGMHVDYTTAGKLMGHLEIGCRIANQKMDAIPDFPENVRVQIIHMILSHHSEHELGSPVTPKTLEGIVLAKIDDLDAQADAFAQVIDETVAKGQDWSDYLPIVSRQVWTKKGPV